MTDHPLAASQIAPSAPTGPGVGTDELEANHPGVWRALSFVLVAAAAILIFAWIVQSRSASDAAAENSSTLDVESTTVVVAEQGFPADARIAVLGIDHREQTPISADGAQLDIPSQQRSVIGLFDGGGALHGLALVSPASDTDQVAISATSTARVLLALSPSLLEANLERTEQKISDIMTDDGFDQLTAAIKANSDLSAFNPGVESALAAILDRVPPPIPFSDQGCDSVLNALAVVVAGTCVEPQQVGATISNEQDRWVLAFVGPAPWSSVCAAISPAGTPGSQRSVGVAECGETVLLAAPGPITDPSPAQAAATNRVRIATGVETYSSYAAPLADLVGSSSGLNRTSNTHILDSTNELVASISGLIGQDPAFESALDVLISSATTIERHTASVAATRTLLDAAGGFVPNWTPQASIHPALLDFYDRVGEQMLLVDRSSWRWSAESSGVLTIGRDS